MIKFILPAIIILFLVIFWEKFNEMIYNKFNVKLNYIVVSLTLISLLIILFLLNN